MICQFIQQCLLFSNSFYAVDFFRDSGKGVIGSLNLSTEFVETNWEIKKIIWEIIQNNSQTIFAISVVEVNC